MTKVGIFDIATPAVLFQKLQHDFQRVSAAPGDRFAAIDFFGTAWSLVDWISSHEHRQVASCPLLEVCRELANNSKHGVLRYTQVKHAKVDGGGFQFPGFDPAVFDVGHLVIELTGEAERQHGHEVRVEVFAARVVEFWRKELGL